MEFVKSRLLDDNGKKQTKRKCAYMLAEPINYTPLSLVSTAVACEV